MAVPVFLKCFNIYKTQPDNLENLITSGFFETLITVWGKRTGHLNFKLCSRDGWTCIYFIFTHTPPINLYSGLPLTRKQNTHAFTHSSLSLSLILTSHNFQIKYALTLAVRETQLKYTLRYLANKFAIFLIKSSLLLTTFWVIETFNQLRYNNESETILLKFNMAESIR